MVEAIRPCAHSRSAHAFEAIAATQPWGPKTAAVRTVRAPVPAFRVSAFLTVIAVIIVASLRAFPAALIQPEHRCQQRVQTCRVERPPLPMQRRANAWGISIE